MKSSKSVRPTRSPGQPLAAAVPLTMALMPLAAMAWVVTQTGVGLV